MSVPSTTPSSAPRPAAEVLRITHRALEYSPSLAEAVAVAADTGAHLIEIDLRLSRDREIVVWHDASVVVDGDQHWVADTDWSDLHGLGSRAELLADALRVIGTAGLGIYADIKQLDPDSIRALAEMLTTAGFGDRAVLASSRTDLVIACAEEAPEYPRALLFPNTDEDAVALGRAVAATYLHPCWERLERPDLFLDQAWFDRARDGGFGTICWHEERPEVIAALYDAGVDGICSDRPDLLREAALAGVGE